MVHGGGWGSPGVGAPNLPPTPEPESQPKPLPISVLIRRKDPPLRPLSPAHTSPVDAGTPAKVEGNTLMIGEHRNLTGLGTLAVSHGSWISRVG